MWDEFSMNNNPLILFDERNIFECRVVERKVSLAVINEFYTLLLIWRKYAVKLILTLIFKVKILFSFRIYFVFYLSQR